MGLARERVGGFQRVAWRLWSFVDFLSVAAGLENYESIVVHFQIYAISSQFQPDILLQMNRAGVFASLVQFQQLTALRTMTLTRSHVPRRGAWLLVSKLSSVCVSPMFGYLNSSTNACARLWNTPLTGVSMLCRTAALDLPSFATSGSSMLIERAVNCPPQT